MIVPFTHDDIKRHLATASRRSAPYTRPGKKECDHERSTAVRDRAVLLLLIDTGMRASELSGPELRNVDLRNGSVVAQVDIVNGHQLASPVENWRLWS